MMPSSHVPPARTAMEHDPDLLDVHACASIIGKPKDWILKVKEVHFG